jgi:hypothetical protein
MTRPLGWEAAGPRGLCAGGDPSATIVAAGSNGGECLLVSSGDSSGGALGHAETINALKRIAEQLLGRTLTAQDGLDANVITKAEQRLGISIPEPLKAVYILVGRLPQFMTAFQQFASPQEICLDAGLLMFLEENQSVCDWGVDTLGRVFQRQGSDSRDLELDIGAFLQLILYYQVAQGGENGYSVTLSDDEWLSLRERAGWKQVVHHDGLIIYCLNSFLVWYSEDEDGAVVDDLLLFASLIDVPDAMKKEYALEQL